ncbi:MAG: lipopolysaccharide heptosyltransferase II [Candidatus Saccharicenans sp.]|uniref:lipopolysaccharide heptosyltransferase II n=1 Tax=Candidatus Saccharicenans sp. TaxID=2819258 RepID=UPI00404945AD
MKILVYLPRSLGASLLAFPCLRSLQQNFPSAQLTIVPPHSYVQFFQNLGLDYQVLTLPEFKDIGGLKRASARLKKLDFDLGLLLDESFASALLFYLARIPQRWGYDREGRGFMLTKKVHLKAAEPQLHLRNHYLNLLTKFGLTVDDGPCRLRLPAAIMEAAASRLEQAGLNQVEKLAIIKPGSSFGLARVWPPDRQAELVRRLLEQGLRVALVGSGSSQEVSGQLRAGLDGRVVDWSGQLSLEETAGIIARASIYLGNDSGLTHLANLLGVPVISLYGPTDPHLCGPAQPPAVVLKKSVPCSPCSYKACPYDHRCLQQISVDEVLEVISSFLAK